MYHLEQQDQVCLTKCMYTKEMLALALAKLCATVVLLYTVHYAMVGKHVCIVSFKHNLLNILCATGF